MTARCAGFDLDILGADHFPRGDTIGQSGGDLIQGGDNAIAQIGIAVGIPALFQLVGYILDDSGQDMMAASRDGRIAEAGHHGFENYIVW